MYYLDCKTSFYKHCNCSNVYTCVLEYCRSINLHGDNISLFCYPNWFCGDNLGSTYGIMQKSFDEDFNKIWSPAEFSAFIELFLKIIEYVMLHSKLFQYFFHRFLDVGWEGADAMDMLQIYKCLPQVDVHRWVLRQSMSVFKVSK